MLGVAAPGVPRPYLCCRRPTFLAVGAPAFR